MQNPFDRIRRNNVIIDDAARVLIGAETVTVITHNGKQLQYSKGQFCDALKHSKLTDDAALAYVAGTVSRAVYNDNIRAQYVDSCGPWSLAYLVSYDSIKRVYVDYQDASRYGVSYKD